jgi:hypothetical protein
MLVEFAAVWTLHVANLLMRSEMSLENAFVLADLVADITHDVGGF